MTATLTEPSSVRQLAGRRLANYTVGMRVAFALIGLLAAAALPAAAQQPLRTNDGHLTPKFDPVGPTRLDAPLAAAPAKPRPVLLRTDRPLGEIAEYDAKASAACRVRDFGQFEQHQGRALVGGRTYGAASAASDTLADHPRVGRPDSVYVIEHQGMTACRVWRVKPAALRAQR